MKWFLKTTASPLQPQDPEEVKNLLVGGAKFSQLTVFVTSKPRSDRHKESRLEETTMSLKVKNLFEQSSIMPVKN